MASVIIYDQNGHECGETTLSPDVFEVAVRPEILHFVIRAQMAARRAGTHQVKTRALVSGGGVKPWKQKGTGRARSGSNRSPVWRGRAIIFGPSPRSYEFKVNKKVRSLALRMALSSCVRDEDLLVVRNIELAEPKTKYFVKVINALGLDNKMKALIVIPENNDKLERSARNIPGLTIITPEQLNVLDVLSHKKLVLFEDAIAPVTERFAVREA